MEKKTLNKDIEIIIKQDGRTIQYPLKEGLTPDIDIEDSKIVRLETKKNK